MVGIDVGITLVMAENLRSGFVWRYFMQATEVRRGLKLAGFAPNVAPGNAPIVVQIGCTVFKGVYASR